MGTRERIGRARRVGSAHVSAEDWEALVVFAVKVCEERNRALGSRSLGTAEDARLIDMKATMTYLLPGEMKIRAAVLLGIEVQLAEQTAIVDRIREHGPQVVRDIDVAEPVARLIDVLQSVMGEVRDRGSRAWEAGAKALDLFTFELQPILDEIAELRRRPPPVEPAQAVGISMGAAGTTVTIETAEGRDIPPGALVAIDRSGRAVPGTAENASAVIGVAISRRNGRVDVALGRT